MPVAGRCYSTYKRATRQKDAAHAGMGREGGAETRGFLGVPLRNITPYPSAIGSEGVFRPGSQRVWRNNRIAQGMARDTVPVRPRTLSILPAESPGSSRQKILKWAGERTKKIPILFFFCRPHQRRRPQGLFSSGMR